MNTLHCYNCGSGRNRYYASENGYCLVKCRDCGLLFIESRPDDDEISQAHAAGRHRGVQELDVTGSFCASKIPRYLGILEDVFRGDLAGIETWLDVGCGHGEFIAAVQEYSGGSIDVKGLEPNVLKQESARSRGLDVGFFDIESHEDRYDMVSMLNVYSHLVDPPAFISSLKGLLSNQGQILIETGDTADLPARKHPRPLYLPDHISFASEKIVSGIIERVGFEVCETRKYADMVFDPIRIVKEGVKTVWPGRKSYLRHYLRKGVYVRRDMFILAKLRTAG